MDLTVSGWKMEKWTTAKLWTLIIGVHFSRYLSYGKWDFGTTSTSVPFFLSRWGQRLIFHMRNVWSGGSPLHLFFTCGNHPKKKNMWESFSGNAHLYSNFIFRWFQTSTCGDPTPIFERVRWHDHHLKMCALRVHFVQREKSLAMRISSVIWKMTRWVYKFSDSDFG